jgi:hypothetical protein
MAISLDGLPLAELHPGPPAGLNLLLGRMLKEALLQRNWLACCGCTEGDREGGLVAAWLGTWLGGFDTDIPPGPPLLPPRKCFRCIAEFQ